MKNKIILFLACLFVGLKSMAQTKEATQLVKFYNAYAKSKSTADLKNFFLSFPASFNSFQKIYGYDEKKGEAPNYGVEQQHIKLFFGSVAVVDKNTFANKLLDIVRNAKWEADAVNDLQAGTREYFFKESATIIPLLAKRTNEIDSFWYFFSDGPHFNEKVFEQTKHILKDNAKMLGAYQKEVKHVKQDNKH